MVVKGDLTRLSGNLSQPILYGAIAGILLLLRIATVKKILIGLRTHLQETFRNLKSGFRKTSEKVS
jgi:hypothetical protein